jgi:chromate transporter
VGTEADLVVWGRVAARSFGGPAAQIAVIHELTVDQHQWLTDEEFVDALAFVNVLPGPEAQQLATYVGWKRGGMLGGLLAGGLFVLPGLICMLVLASLYVRIGSVSWVAAMFAGLAPAMLIVVAQAVHRMGKRLLIQRWQQLLALVAGVAMLIGVPFPVVMLLAGLCGWWKLRGDAVSPRPSSVRSIPVRARRMLHVLVVGAVLWVVPLIVSGWWAGTDSVVFRQARFFAGAAVVTFGGAYALLSFVAQHVVTEKGWVTPTDMATGLALAESTPGPLLMVLQFVAFIGAYRSPGGTNPWLAATVGALLVTWVTFVPSFTMVLAGAPALQRLRSIGWLRSALGGVSAATVGAIGYLGIYLAVHTLFGTTKRYELSTALSDVEIPVFTAWRPLHTLIACVAAGAALRLRWKVGRLLVIGAVMGALLLR